MERLFGYLERGTVVVGAVGIAGLVVITAPVWGLLVLIGWGVALWERARE